MGIVEDRELVRSLGAQVAAIAREPRMQAVRRRWAAVNGLRRADRAPVWCKPVGCWSEILPPEALRCSDPELRRIEYGLRQTIFKRELGDDTIVPEWYTVRAVFQAEPANRWGVEVGRHAAKSSGGAWSYDPPLRRPADLDRLVMPRWQLDRAETERQAALAEELFRGLMPVRVMAVPPWEGTVGTDAADLVGLEQLMLLMVDEPEMVHRLMAHIRDTYLRSLDEIEASGLLDARLNSQPMYHCDPLPGTPADGPVRCEHLMCMANAQEFDQVSPGMWQEFCLPYQLPIFARFGGVIYGCCENLTRKLDGVLGIPKLRVVTCSAWTRLDTVIEKVGRKHCIMWRQKASDVVFPDDDAKIFADLEDGARRLKGLHYQIVLRELQTLAGHPDRLHVWTRHAIAAAETHAN